MTGATSWPTWPSSASRREGLRPYPRHRRAPRAAGSTLREAVPEALPAPLWEVSRSGEPEDPRSRPSSMSSRRRRPRAPRPRGAPGIFSGPDAHPLEARARSPRAEWRARRSAVGDIEAGRTTFEGDAVVVALPGRIPPSPRCRSGRPPRGDPRGHGLRGGSRPDLREPGWFREGIALWFSGEGPARVREAIAWSVFQGSRGCVPREHRPLRGAGRLRSRPRCGRGLPPRDVARGRAGARRAPRLVREAVRGKPVSDLLDGALKAPPRRLRERALAHSRAEVARLIDRGPRTSSPEVARPQVPGRPGATRIWADLLARDPRGPLAGTLLYLLGRAALEEEGPVQGAVVARGGARPPGCAVAAPSPSSSSASASSPRETAGRRSASGGMWTGVERGRGPRGERAPTYPARGPSLVPPAQSPPPAR